MKLVATSRAARLSWAERSAIDLRCKAGVRTGGSPIRYRHQSTSNIGHGLFSIEAQY